MNLQNDTVVIVGDKFSAFAGLEGVVSISQFVAELDRARPDDPLPSQVVVGQGVSDGWLAYIEARALELGGGIVFDGERRVADRPGRHLCHKWQRRNVLITRPVQLSPTQYEMQLSIDDDCEIMSDHVTGHHVQGMVLMEAARQSFLAVTECFLLEGKESYYFVIDKFNVAFHRFVFPVRVDMQFELQEVDRSRSDRVKANAVIRFLHCNELACQTEVSYTAIQDARLRPKEEQMARDALSHLISSYPKAPVQAVAAQR